MQPEQPLADFISDWMTRKDEEIGPFYNWTYEELARDILEWQARE